MLFDCKGADIITPIKYTALSLKSFYRGVSFCRAKNRLTPNVAALVDPLFAFGGKKVVKNKFVMLNIVKHLLFDMHVIE
jgi:hypothetical protein